MRKFSVILFVILFLLPILKTQAQSSNAGFVPGNIWYSKDPFEEGDKINIYTLVFNPDQRELLGTVTFFDNTTFLGKKDFSIAAKGVKDIFISWTVTTGDHIIFAKIENARFLVSKDTYEDVYLAQNETEKSTRTVSKKIIVSNIDSKVTTDNSPNLIQKITDTAQNITPDYISAPVNNTVGVLDKLRDNTGKMAEANKTLVNNEIKKIDATKNTKTTNNAFLKPFKYVEFFFLTLISFIFNNKIVFYGILILIIFLILRYIWRKIF